MDKSKKTLTLAKIVQPKPKTTELAYVTSVHIPTRTFFAQLCKFSYKELTKFEVAIESSCKKVVAQRESDDSSATVPKKIRPGEIYCAEYSNKKWYRAVVMDKDEANQGWSVLFIDYGNVSTVTEDSMVHIDLEMEPAITREPFGISCCLKDSDKYPEEQALRLLASLKHSYVMIKILEKQSNVQWLVDIPFNAYNSPFWEKFEPETPKTLKSKPVQRNQVGLKSLDTSTSDEETAVASAVCG